MKKVFFLLLLFVNIHSFAQRYAVCAMKEEGTWEYSTIEQRYQDFNEIFRVQGDVVLHSYVDDDDDDDPTIYRYNIEASQVLEAPTYVYYVPKRDVYISISFLNNGQILEINPFDIDNPGESAFDKWCTVYTPQTVQNGNVLPFVPQGNLGMFSGGGYSSPNNSGSTSSICKGCNGLGKCTTCDGKGKYWEEVGLFTGQDTKKLITCPVCKGTGHCGVCHGRGSIR